MVGDDSVELESVKPENPLELRVPTELPLAVKPIVPADGRYIPVVSSDPNVTPGAAAVPLLNLIAPVIVVWPSADTLCVSAEAISEKFPFVTALDMVVPDVYGEFGRLYVPLPLRANSVSP